MGEYNLNMQNRSITGTVIDNTTNTSIATVSINNNKDINLSINIQLTNNIDITNNDIKLSIRGALKQLMEDSNFQTWNTLLFEEIVEDTTEINENTEETPIGE